MKLVLVCACYCLEKDIYLNNAMFFSCCGMEKE